MRLAKERKAVLSACIGRIVEKTAFQYFEYLEILWELEGVAQKIGTVVNANNHIGKKCEILRRKSAKKQ